LSIISLFLARVAILHKNVSQEEMMGKQPMKKTRKTTPQRRSRNHLTKTDMQALTVLDRIVEEDRRIEQKYNLPFRSPRQVATSVQQCTHCQENIALMIFGDFAKDAAGLEAYARLTEDLIKQTCQRTSLLHPAIHAISIVPPYCLKPTQSKRNLISPHRQNGKH
jgi:hypothetical protein